MPGLDWDRTITCPYNPSHQISAQRIQVSTCHSSCRDRLSFQWHLVKCRKSHPGSDHVICPFNASHHVPRQEQEFHLTSCPDRKMVEVER